MINHLRPGQTERIAHLFRRGYSIDLVAELGVINGWTRADAKAVLAEQGWALDWTGRLQRQFASSDMPVTPSIAQADPERLLNAGIDHENPEIRKAALAAEKAVERLRGALMDQERRDADRASVRAAQTVFGSIPLPQGLMDRFKLS